MIKMNSHVLSNSNNNASILFTQYPRNKPHHCSLRKKFSLEEDNMLRTLVENCGLNQWNIVAQYMKNRTARQCRDRYRNYLQPGFFNGQWSAQEDEMLYQKYQEFGPQWTLLSQLLKGRSANSIKNRWNYFVSRMNFDYSKIIQSENDEHLVDEETHSETDNEVSLSSPEEIDDKFTKDQSSTKNSDSTEQSDSTEHDGEFFDPYDQNGLFSLSNDGLDQIELYDQDQMLFPLENLFQ
ncbi:Myb-like DNA-binding domain containing protein [Tritrichomonas foetus]|uniref:Myb-like DNA-binding domain containing protein n=1 Tax=Tritrichomonas foetus TaxID=1144522 RepID=A0A1J4L1T5_9EUKA|nr:Myb-like DNA-binding domain containing protein [Tritrichomonas foetus]|eukprot:OHT17378.1 Myb-like DNA-binding domain containing protein [Tritrichomonas foetus]